MKYTLMRSSLCKKGSIFMELIFDLWNYEYETGYEIKVNLYKMTAWNDLIYEYIKKLSGHTYDISRWDFIIRNIKQMKLDKWVIYEEGEKND